MYCLCHRYNPPLLPHLIYYIKHNHINIIYLLVYSRCPPILLPLEKNTQPLYYFHSFLDLFDLYFINLFLFNYYMGGRHEIGCNREIPII
jgi:hypothetical protein